MRDRFDKRGRGRFVPPAKGSGTIRPNLETGTRHQQNCTDRHKENARPIRSEPQESHAAPWRLQSVANRPGGILATKRSPPDSSASQVQDSAENKQRAKPHQEHSGLSIHRCPAQHNRDKSIQARKRSGQALYSAGHFVLSTTWVDRRWRAATSIKGDPGRGRETATARYIASAAA